MSFLSRKKTAAEAAVTAAEEIIAKAKEATRADYDKMLEQLKGEISRLVVETTSKVIGRTLSDEDQKRLNSEALLQLGQETKTSSK